MKRAAILAGLCLMAALNAAAENRPPMLKDSDLTAETFSQVETLIRQHLQNAGTRVYSSAERQRVERSLDNIVAFLASDRPSAGSKIRREQKRINSILLPEIAGDTGDSEVICKSRARVGSHIATTRCQTREEMERERHEANQTMDRMRNNCTGSAMASSSGSGLRGAGQTPCGGSN